MKKMTPKQKDILVLVLLVIALFAINYSWLNNALDNFLNTYEQVHVDRIIDGDTIESNKTSIRLLGVNAPERGEYFYEEAKEFLEKEILNQSVGLKYGKERYDKYDRVLAYVFFNKENINIKIVEEGYANYYFYGGRDVYSDELLDAWQVCLDNNVNLCEKSNDKCAQCVKIKDTKTIINTCSFSCNINNWEIKEEGRDKFVFSDKILQPNAEADFELDLTDTGGGLFLRDKEEKLVEWKKS
jgi:endonuclease YncB( thermonuclease family)